MGEDTRDNVVQALTEASQALASAAAALERLANFIAAGGSDEPSEPVVGPTE